MADTQTGRLDKDCPKCRGAGHTDTQSADRGNRTYKFECLACGGSGRVKTAEAR